MLRLKSKPVLVSALLLSVVFFTATTFTQRPRKRVSSPSGAVAANNIRQVDFKNFIYQFRGKQIRLRKGEYDGRDIEGHWQFGRNFQTDGDLLSYGDLTGDGKEEAVVVLMNDVTGSYNAVEQYGFIYSVRDGQVIKLADFKAGHGPCGEPRVECSVNSVGIESGLLTVDRAVSTENDANCCPSGHRSRSYRLNGNRLIEVAAPSIKETSRSSMLIPQHIWPKHRAVLQQVLLNRPGWRPATMEDAFAGETDEGREYKRGEIAYHGKNFHPYYAVGDFNQDGSEDFAVILINADDLPPKFAVAIFNGPFTQNQRPVPTFFSEKVSSNDWLFWVTDDRFGKRFLVGPPGSDAGFIIRPRGRRYIVE